MRVSRTFYRAAVLVCLFCWAGYLLFTSRTEARELHFINIHWPPFIIVESPDRIEGIDLDILREMAERLGVELKIDSCP